MQKYRDGVWHRGSTDQCWQIVIIALLDPSDFLEKENLSSFQDFFLSGETNLSGLMPIGIIVWKTQVGLPGFQWR